MSKVPGAAPHEKSECMLDAAFGIGSNGDAAARPQLGDGDAFPEQQQAESAFVHEPAIPPLELAKPTPAPQREPRKGNWSSHF